MNDLELGVTFSSSVHKWYLALPERVKNLPYWIGNTEFINTDHGAFAGDRVRGEPGPITAGLGGLHPSMKNKASSNITSLTAEIGYNPGKPRSFILEIVAENKDGDIIETTPFTLQQEGNSFYADTKFYNLESGEAAPTFVEYMPSKASKKEITVVHTTKSWSIDPLDRDEKKFATVKKLSNNKIQISLKKNTKAECRKGDGFFEGASLIIGIAATGVRNPSLSGDLIYVSISQHGTRKNCTRDKSFVKPLK